MLLGAPRTMKFVMQFQENKRPSRFVILSAAKDLSPDRDPSLRSGWQAWGWQV